MAVDFPFRSGFSPRNTDFSLLSCPTNSLLAFKMFPRERGVLLHTRVVNVSHTHTRTQTFDFGVNDDAYRIVVEEKRGN